MGEEANRPPAVTSEESTFTTARGVPRTEILLKCPALNVFRVIRDASRQVAIAKAEAQIEAWNAKCRDRHYMQDSAVSAALRTQEAQATLHELQSLLRDSLGVSHGIRWPELRSPFAEPRPEEPAPAHTPRQPGQPRDPGPEPNLDDDRYLPPWRVSLVVDAVVPGRWQKRLEELRQIFETDHRAWQIAVALRDTYPEKLREWEEDVTRARQAAEELRQKWESDMRAWESRSRQHEADDSARVAAWREAMARGERAAVEECFAIVLERSEYPSCLPHQFDLALNPETRILVCDSRLPCPSALPTLREVAFVKTRNALMEKHLSKRESESLYDLVVYQMCLRTVHELFSADECGVLELVTFNGWVEDVDRATGKDFRSCILSLQVSRKEFEGIDLARVEPRECFRALKGVGSSRLHALAPIAPLLQLNREDDRFVEAREVVARMEHGTNLAAMDWEDFEHLIREVFEEEFAERGGEVKITQASRDRGVDAVVFDPDPITGGKIILQAKRYTNTVGVEAVRDLYGTVINEGANMGILVTTSDYGPDAYQFARNKPIRLLNGSNLLHLLGKHGHRARIDLREAKLQLADEASERT